MNQSPSIVVAEWLNRLYVSLLSPERSREAFNRTGKFKKPSFLAKVEMLSDEVDQLVFDASFVGDFPAIKDFIAKAPQDVVDILVYRFNLCMVELETGPGTLTFPDKPDILAVFRLLLIRNEQVRNGPWQTH